MKVQLQVAIATACGLVVCGCGGSSHSPSSSSTPSSPGSPVIVGTNPNSLPTPPKQTGVNSYAGVDLQGSIDMLFHVSHPGQSYYYQQPGASSSNNERMSGGVFASEADFEYLSETDNLFVPYTFAGFGAEIDGAAALLQEGYGDSPADVLFGVPLQQTGCLAPNGSVAFNFLQVPISAPKPYSASTDGLYGSANLGYANGVFTYSAVQEVALGGASATTVTIPFSDSYCISAPEGYGIQSPTATVGGSSGSVLVYLGSTGFLVGEVEGSGSTGLTHFVGVVQPGSAVDIESVTKGSYKGFYLPVDSPPPGNPAYFGQSSKWIAAPVFKQSASSLIGGNESAFNLLFGPVAAIPGNILVDFGVQDPHHPGLFPSATFKEPDPNNLCPAKQQTNGPEGVTYCTFPVAALIGESYGQYTIFIAGLEQTTGSPMFYALVEN